MLIRDQYKTTVINFNSVYKIYVGIDFHNENRFLIKYEDSPDMQPIALDLGEFDSEEDAKKVLDTITSEIKKGTAIYDIPTKEELNRKVEEK